MKTCEVQEKALEIEGKLRKKDSTMGYIYQEGAVQIINGLKNCKSILRTDDLAKIINNLV